MVACGIGDRLGMMICFAMGLGLVSSILASPDGIPSQAETPLIGTWRTTKNPTNDNGHSFPLVLNVDARTAAWCAGNQRRFAPILVTNDRNSRSLTPKCAPNIH